MIKINGDLKYFVVVKLHYLTHFRDELDTTEYTYYQLWWYKSKCIADILCGRGRKSWSSKFLIIQRKEWTSSIINESREGSLYWLFKIAAVIRKASAGNEITIGRKEQGKCGLSELNSLLS